MLLPGANLQESATIAESLRQAICGERMIGDLRLTMSFGVGASTGDERFDYEAVFAEADNALYAAKAAGRDCVQRAIPVAERAIAHLSGPANRSRSRCGSRPAPPSARSHG